MVIFKGFKILTPADKEIHKNFCQRMWDLSFVFQVEIHPLTNGRKNMIKGLAEVFRCWHLASIGLQDYFPLPLEFDLTINLWSQSLHCLTVFRVLEHKGSDFFH